jgi:hypothetical protein
VLAATTEPINWKKWVLPIVQPSPRQYQGYFFLPVHSLFTTRSAGAVEEVVLSINKQSDACSNFLLFSLFILRKKIQHLYL